MSALELTRAVDDVLTKLKNSLLRHSSSVSAACDTLDRLARFLRDPDDATRARAEAACAESFCKLLAAAEALLEPPCAGPGPLLGAALAHALFSSANLTHIARGVNADAGASGAAKRLFDALACRNALCAHTPDVHCAAAAVLAIPGIMPLGDEPYRSTAVAAAEHWILRHGGYGGGGDDIKGSAGAGAGSNVAGRASGVGGRAVDDIESRAAAVSGAIWLLEAVAGCGPLHDSTAGAAPPRWPALVFEAALDPRSSAARSALCATNPRTPHGSTALDALLPAAVAALRTHVNASEAIDALLFPKDVPNEPNAWPLVTQRFCALLESLASPDCTIALSAVASLSAILEVTSVIALVKPARLDFSDFSRSTAAPLAGGAAAVAYRLLEALGAATARSAAPSMLDALIFCLLGTAARSAIPVVRRAAWRALRSAVDVATQACGAPRQRAVNFAWTDELAKQTRHTRVPAADAMLALSEPVAFERESRRFIGAGAGTGVGAGAGAGVEVGVGAGAGAGTNNSNSHIDEMHGAVRAEVIYTWIYTQRALCDMGQRLEAFKRCVAPALLNAAHTPLCAGSNASPLAPLLCLARSLVDSGSPEAAVKVPDSMLHVRALASCAPAWDSEAPMAGVAACTGLFSGAEVESNAHVAGAISAALKSAHTATTRYAGEGNYAVEAAAILNVALDGVTRLGRERGRGTV